MKIAVTYDVLTNSIFQHFGKTQSFKVYEIEDGKVKTSAVIDNGGFGHHDLATYLKNLGVETLILGKRGQGPVECEFAVRLLFEALQKEFKAHTFEIKSKNESRFCDGWSSVIFETSADLAFLEGSVEWKCQSYLRPGHKRKIGLWM